MTRRQHGGQSRIILERKFLQIAIGAACLIPISGGLLGVVQGTGMLEHCGDSTFDSHFRYLSGLLLGVGVAFLSTIKDIETHRSRFRVLSFIVVVGGVARLLSFMAYGWPATPMVGALIMELVVVPLLVLWQGRVANLISLKPQGQPTVSRSK